MLILLCVILSSAKLAELAFPHQCILLPILVPVFGGGGGGVFITNQVTDMWTAECGGNYEEKHH